MGMDGEGTMSDDNDGTGVEATTGFLYYGVSTL
jgi:hypothetical protein